MPQIGGKDAKRHFTVVMGDKEHGLYVSSTPSSAAKKAVTKLCAANKGKKVEFHIREITQGSKKKTYGPYEGYVEKFKKPIEHKQVAKLLKKTSKKMRGGAENSTNNQPQYRYNDLSGIASNDLLGLKKNAEEKRQKVTELQKIANQKRQNANQLQKIANQKRIEAEQANQIAKISKETLNALNHKSPNI